MFPSTFMIFFTHKRNGYMLFKHCVCYVLLTYLLSAITFIVSLIFRLLIFDTMNPGRHGNVYTWVKILKQYTNGFKLVL